MQFRENDYKYVIQDFSNVYVGARFSYGELVESDDVPGRLKDAVCRIFYREAAPDMTIGEHLCRLSEGDGCYMAYAQLKIRIKVTELVQDGDKAGREREHYQTTDYGLAEFMKQEDIRQNPGNYLIQEISFKKRHLLAMHV